MSRPLFRREAVDAQRSSWLGSISLTQPMPVVWMAGLVLFAATALVTFLVLGEYTRRARVSGTLVPDRGLSLVVAPAQGLVSRVLPEEGERVSAGDGLVVVGAARAEVDGNDSLEGMRKGLDTRRQSLDAALAASDRQFESRRLGLEKQLAQTTRELGQIEDEIRTRAEQVALAEDKVKRYSSIAAERYVSQIQLREQELAVLELINARQALERQHTAAQREYARIHQALAELPSEQASARAVIAREVAELAMERIEQEGRGERTLKAAVAGLVAQRLVEPGQSVREGEHLLTLLPDGSRLQAQLLVPSSAIAFIAPGDRVLLRYQAFPYQKFGHHEGRVLRIARSALPAGVAGEDSQYRVLVAIDRQAMQAYGREEPLRPGMRVEADILAERRKLYEWLFEPLFALRAKAG